MKPSRNPLSIQGRSELHLPSIGGAASYRYFPRPDVAAPGGAATIRLPVPVGPPRADVRRSAFGTLVLYLIDQSGSIFGLDPTDVRAAACRSLLDLQRRAGGGRGALVHFGSEAPAEYVTGPLDVVASRRELAAAATSPADLGGTSLAAPIVRAADLIRNVGGIPKTIVFLITDATEPVGAAQVALGALPPHAEAHAVLINAPHGLAANWDSSRAFTSVLAVSQPTVRELATALGTTYAAALGAHLPTTRKS